MALAALAFVPRALILLCVSFGNPFLRSAIGGNVFGSSCCPNPIIRLMRVSCLCTGIGRFPTTPVRSFSSTKSAKDVPSDTPKASILEEKISWTSVSLKSCSSATCGPSTDHVSSSIACCAVSTACSSLSNSPPLNCTSTRFPSGPNSCRLCMTI